jgi:hypothetical protein
MKCFEQKSMTDKEKINFGIKLIKQGYVESRKSNTKSGIEVKITPKGRTAYEMLGRIIK